MSRLRTLSLVLIYAAAVACRTPERAGDATLAASQSEAQADPVTVDGTLRFVGSRGGENSTAALEAFRGSRRIELDLENLEGGPNVVSALRDQPVRVVGRMTSVPGVLAPERQVLVVKNIAPLAAQRARTEMDGVLRLVGSRGGDTSGVILELFRGGRRIELDISQLENGEALVAQLRDRNVHATGSVQRVTGALGGSREVMLVETLTPR